jgi:hypothetical protein
MTQQIITGIALFLGETIIIGAELWAAKNFSASPHPWWLVACAFFVSLIGVALLIYGYTWGYQAFKNIWIVVALSVAGILIVEPIVAWTLFHEIPTKGAAIGFLLGVIGIVTTVFVK